MHWRSLNCPRWIVQHFLPVPVFGRPRRPSALDIPVNCERSGGTSSVYFIVIFFRTMLARPFRRVSIAERVHLTQLRRNVISLRKKFQTRRYKNRRGWRPRKKWRTAPAAAAQSPSSYGAGESKGNCTVKRPRFPGNPECILRQ